MVQFTNPPSGTNLKAFASRLRIMCLNLLWSTSACLLGTPGSPGKSCQAAGDSLRHGVRLQTTPLSALRKTSLEGQHQAQPMQRQTNAHWRPTDSAAKGLRAQAISLRHIQG